MAQYSNAASFTAAYFNGAGLYGYREFLQNNPKIGDMGLMPYSGDATTDNVSALNLAIKLVGFIAQYRFDLHENKDLQTCINETVAVLTNKEKRASDLSDVINATFVFLDEVGQ